MSDVPLLSEISGLSFHSPFPISSLVCSLTKLFFVSLRKISETDSANLHASRASLKTNQKKKKMIRCFDATKSELYVCVNAWVKVCVCVPACVPVYVCVCVCMCVWVWV